MSKFLSSVLFLFYYEIESSLSLSLHGFHICEFEFETFSDAQFLSVCKYSVLKSVQILKVL